jgi:hypothetical protein
MEVARTKSDLENAGRQVALPDAVDSMPWSKELIKAIAMDIGKEVIAYVEVQYPQAITATSSTFKLSLRNCIYNQIMAAIEVNDAGQIAARLETRKKFRRQWTAAWRKIRSSP